MLLQDINSLTFFFNRLKNIKTFLIQFQKNGSFFGFGKGSVIVEQKEKAIVFYEKGSWQNAENEVFDFTNIYRFQLKENRLSIEHLRSANPTFLSYLVFLKKYLLASEEKYLCNQDQYMAKFSLEKDSFHLIWTITGPAKNDQIFYTYQSC